MHKTGGKLETVQRVYRLTLTPELSGLLSSNQNLKKKTIGSSGSTGYNRKENAKIKIAEMNMKLNDKKNRDKLRKEDALLSNSDGAKVRVTLEEMHGWGGDYRFGTDRDDEVNEEIPNFQNTLLTSTSVSASTSSLTSTPLNTFSKTSKFGLKNDLRELHGDVLKRSTSLLTENKEENENGNENEIDSRRFLWDNKEVLLRDDRDGNDVKEVVKVEGVHREVGVRNGAPIGVTGYTPTITTGGETPGVRGREGREGRGLGRIEAQNIVQTQHDNEVQKQGQGQGQDKALGKGNLISYIRMTAFDRIGSKVLVNILDDQVRTYDRSITLYVHFTFKTSC